MKKKILFAIIALVTLLAFTGCDKILEFMFPDSTGGGGGEWGDKSIQVQVTVIDESIDWANYDIYVELSVADDQGNVAPTADAYRVGRAAIPFGGTETTPSVTFRYDGLNNKNYSVRVWMDINPNFGVDPEDPNINAHTDMGWTSITFPFYDNDGNEQKQVNLFAELQAPPPPVDDATPFVFVKGPLNYDVNNAYVQFVLDTTVEGRSFDSVSYEIYDPGWNYIWGDTVYGSNVINLDMSGNGLVGYWGWYDGTYRLRITAASTDGEDTAPWSMDTDFRLVYPAGYYDYYADVSGGGFDSWPWYLDWSTNYPVKVSYYDGYGNPYLDQEVGISGGSFYSSAYWDGWLVASYNYADVLNAGKALVIIDKDLDATYGSAGDLEAEVTFALDQWMYDYGGYLWPTFDANPGRFIPYSDFGRIYGYN